MCPNRDEPNVRGANYKASPSRETAARTGPATGPVSVTVSQMEKIGEALERIERRLESLEKKVEQTKLEPRAFSKPEAAKMLGIGLTKLKALVAKGKIRTVTYEDGDHPLVPMSEIVRMTLVSSVPSSAPASSMVPVNVKPQRSAVSRDTEAEKIRALRKKKR